MKNSLLEDDLLNLCIVPVPQNRSSSVADNALFPVQISPYVGKCQLHDQPLSHFLIYT